jgi:hypothetical protein
MKKKEFSVSHYYSHLSSREKISILAFALVFLMGLGVVIKSSGIFLGAEVPINTLTNVVTANYCTPADTTVSCDPSSGKYSLSKTASVSTTVQGAPDTIAPTINITSPVSGASVKGTVTVKSTTSDNVGVVRVELYVDGRRTYTSSSTPFDTKWNATKGTHSLQTRAYDAAGNVGASQVVTVRR